MAADDHLALIFFSFSFGFVVLSVLLLLQRRRPWCCCDVCWAYLTSSWAAEFDSLCDWHTHLLRRSPTHTVHIHVLATTITANPANVEHMLAARFDNFPKGKPFSAILGDLLGHGIFNADGDAWRFQRKMASLDLGSASVRSYALGIISGQIRGGLLPLLRCAAQRQAGAIDLQDVFWRFAFDTICLISFGLDRGSLEPAVPLPEFAAAFDAASRLSVCRAATSVPAVWKLKRLLNIGSERELRQAIAVINKLAAEVIRQRREKGFKDNHDLLSRFMASVDDDDVYLRDIVVSFLLAGRDAVASALTGFFLLLSRHPHVAESIRRDIDGVKGEVSYELLKEMNYVHAAIYESLRLLPPIQSDSKFCAEDDVLPDGTFVRRGTRVTYHPYAMGRMERIWGPDCEEFRPERWLRGGAFSAENLFKYPVFQAGPRICLGKELAVLEMKAVVVSVMREFDVEVVGGGAPLKFVPALSATIDGGVPALVWRRHGDST